MSFDVDNKESRLLKRAIKSVDRLLLPFAAGVCSVVVIVQLVCTIPTVRNTVDKVAGRFVPVTAEDMSATPVHLTLYLSPSEARPDVQVWVNGLLRTTFSRDAISLDVYAGDDIEFKTISNREADITFDSDTANLAYPAPGYTITLGSQFHKVSLGKVKVIS